MKTTTRPATPLLVAAALLAGAASPGLAQNRSATPQALVASYSSLADVVVATKQAERHLVLAILDATYRAAEAALNRARASLAAGQSARADVEALAAQVALLGNEGDAAVAGIRKRLVEGGHHHNAAGEQQGVYEEGYVVVTRAAKKAFLESATRIGKLAANPDAGALDAQWQRVQQQYRQLLEEESR